jgi:hypothetical protein
MMEERLFNDISFRAFLDEEKFMGSRCKKCGVFYFPPRPICVKCYNSEMEWVELSGRGNLAGYNYTYVGPPWTIEEGYDRQHPYCVGVVELEEGVRAVARIEGVDLTNPESPKIGMPLQVTFLHRGEGEKAKTLLAFKPA